MRRAEWGRDRAFPVLAYDGEFPVDLLVRHDDLVLGRDEATVAFVDGWLVVDGRRASFALRPRDVDRLGDGSVALSGGGWLQFHAQGRAAEFERALIDWSWQAVPTQGAPVFPPLRVHPALLGRAVLRLSGWGLGAVAIAALACAGWPLIALAASGFVALGAYADAREASRLLAFERRVGERALLAREAR